MALTSSTLSRYRSTFLYLSGSLAFVGLAYILYRSTAPQPSNNLQRRGAVRHRRNRQRPLFPDGGIIGVQNRLQDAERESHVYGTGTYHGTTINLSLSNNDSRRIQRLLPNIPPEFSNDDWEALLNQIHGDFLQYFLRSEFGARPLLPEEFAEIARWLELRGMNPEVIAEGIHTYTGGRPEAGARPSQDGSSRPDILLDGQIDTSAWATSDGRETVAPTEQSFGGSIRHVDVDDGELLRRAVYFIAEDRTRNEGVKHRGITCDACGAKPIRGIRWRCVNCADFDLCSSCESTNEHDKTHVFLKVKIPAPYLGYPRQPLAPAYPGRPEMMPTTVPTDLKKKINEATKTSLEEIEGLWEQFTCLANARWPEDPSGICWAIDRQAFDRSFRPHYADSTPSPNLIYDRVFSFYDTNGDNLIGFEEWTKGLADVHSRDPGVRLRIAFNGYDLDGDGLVTRRDFLRLFRAYYAIQKESTHNYISVQTQAMAAAGAIDHISASRPLGAIFNEATIPYVSRTQLPNNKGRDSFGDPLGDEPVVHDNVGDRVDRTQFLATEANRSRLDNGDPTDFQRERWERRDFYVDEEEGFEPSNHVRHGSEADELSSVLVADGTEGEASSAAGSPVEMSVPGVADNTDAPSSHSASQEHFLESSGGDQDESLPEASTNQNLLNRASRSSSRVRFQDDVDLETRSNASTHASTSSRPVGERWGGYEIPQPEKDLGRDLLYQITQQGFNELLDPLFRAKEDLAVETDATKDERRKWRHLIEEHMGKPLNSLDSVAIVGARLGEEKFKEEFEEILSRFVILHSDIYRELGPAAVSTYEDDVREADREMVHRYFQYVDSSEELPSAEELDRAVEIRMDIVGEFRDEIAERHQEASAVEDEHGLLDAEIVNQPLHNLLAQSGYRVDSGDSQGEAQPPSDVTIDNDVIAAHIADAQRRVRESLQVSEQAYHRTIEASPTHGIYRDPTMPQFRPNTLGEASSSQLQHLDILMSGAPNVLSNFSSRPVPLNLTSNPLSSNPGNDAFDLTDSSSYFTDSTPSSAGLLAEQIPDVEDSTQPAQPEDPAEFLEQAISLLHEPIEKQLTTYSAEGQAKAYSGHIAAAKHFQSRLDRQPPPWRLGRLVLLEKLEREMQQRGGPGKLTFEEFCEIVRRDGDVGTLSHLMEIIPSMIRCAMFNDWMDALPANDASPV